MIRRRGPLSFARLRGACGKYEREEEMERHNATSQQSYDYFLQKNIDHEEALACAFAIAFYTGNYSEAVNQTTALITRNYNREALFNTEASSITPEKAIIIYYIIKGLSYIEFYWGITTRCVKLDEKEIVDYQIGSVITWLQFSSSNKGSRPAQWFRDLCRKEIISEKNHIYLRQLELGLSKYVVLWVDDHIFDDWWENKQHMEKASTLGTDINVHCIPKSNTNTALAFLRSEFGQRLKSSQTFRLVTDMNRENEIPIDNAGARFIFDVRQLGFTHPCLIFTSNAREGRKKLSTIFQDKKLYGIQISENIYDLERFIHFK